MDTATKKIQKKKEITYKQLTSDQKEKLLNEKDKRNTQVGTERAITHFMNFLSQKTLGNIESLDPPQLNGILLDYYCAIQPQNSKQDDEQYSVQTMKCMRAALNRYFRKNRGFDIVKDPDFVRANEMFKAVCVESK